MTDRLQKIISASGLMSRRAAEEAILCGRVQVNGRTAALGDKAEPSVDRILVDGVPLPNEGGKVYIMLNKPKGYVTTLHDEKGRKNVTDLVGDVGCRVYPVGRLDMNSEGLLLLTNDGDFANRLMHPSHEVKKIYLTWVKGADIAQAAETLRAPMVIDGYAIRPAAVEIREQFPGRALLAVTIHEGRNRQVRKMCLKAGLQVTRLLRVSEGALSLGDLPSGKWRHLTQDEVHRLMAAGECETGGT